MTSDAVKRLEAWWSEVLPGHEDILPTSVHSDIRTILDERDALITRESELREMLLGVIQDNGGRVSAHHINHSRDVSRLRSVLETISEWPDGGNRYGQSEIKKFAQAALQESATHD